MKATRKLNYFKILYRCHMYVCVCVYVDVYMYIWPIGTYTCVEFLLILRSHYFDAPPPVPANLFLIKLFLV